MKKILLALIVMITLWSCSKKDDNNNSLTNTSAIIHVKVTNHITYNGNPEGITHIVFYDVTDTTKQLGMTSAIHYDSTFVGDIDFSKTGQMKCIANVNDAGFLSHCPYQMITVIPNQDLIITFNNSLP